MIDDYYVNSIVYYLMIIILTLCLYFKCPGCDVKARELNTIVKREECLDYPVGLVWLC